MTKNQRRFLCEFLFYSSDRAWPISCRVADLQGALKMAAEMGVVADEARLSFARLSTTRGDRHEKADVAHWAQRRHTKKNHHHSNRRQGEPRE